MSEFAMGPHGGRVWWDRAAQKWLVRGEQRDQLIGRTWFKLPALLSMHFAGKGDEYPGGAMNVAESGIEHNQRLFGREDVVLRVLGETGGWRPQPAGSGMFGSPPQDQGLHDVASYRNLCRTGDRVRDLTALNENVIETLFRLSHETGCIFEYVIIATLKHTDGLCLGVLDHVGRQTAASMRSLAPLYPRAAFIVSYINEANAHVAEVGGISANDVNMWARRWYRWKHPDGRTKQSFTPPSSAHEPEQWPEAFLIVDDGGGDIFRYECGPEPDRYKAAMIHPGRKGHNGGEPWAPRDWRVIPGAMLERLRADARGQPYGATESMFCLTRSDTAGWYRNRSGWNDNLDDQIAWTKEMLARLHYVIVHDDIGAQSDPAHADEFLGRRWEARLAELVGGNAGGGVEPEPPPPDEPPPPASDAVTAHVSGPAENGVVYVQLEFRDWPRVVGGVEAADSVLEEHVVELPRSYTWYAGGSFIGLDRGDVGEFDVRIACDGGPMIYQRSLHKETAAPFDSEDWKYAALVRCSRLRIWIGARTTGPNEILRPGQEWSSRPHFGARLWSVPDGYLSHEERNPE